MDRGLFRGHEPRAHVDPFGPKGECRGKLTSLAKSAGRNNRNVQRICRQRHQQLVGDIVFAHVARTFEPVNRDHIHAKALRGQGVAHGGAFVNDLDLGILEHRNEFARIVPGGFDNLDTVINDRLRIILARDRFE